MQKIKTNRHRKVFLLLVLAAALVAVPALAGKVGVDKLEAETGIRLVADEEVVIFVRGDILTGVVTILPGRPPS